MEISLLGFKVKKEMIFLFSIIVLALVGHLLFSTTTFPLTETFVGVLNDGESASYTLGSYNGTIMPTNTWGRQSLDVVQGKPLSPAVQSILNRPKQQLPLPEGELNMFETTPFKPECCPNAYSNSSGCACMTTDQYNYLITRGGNNVPYSEY
jgi:hypothetical protein